MLPNRQSETEVRAKQEVARKTGRTSLIIAVIAATTALTTTAFNYWFTERTRTAVLEQTAALDSIKIDILKAAQKTSESLAGIDAARLDIQRQVAAIDSSRLDLQREANRAATANETKRIAIEDSRGRSDQIRLGSELSRAQNEIIPVVDAKCTISTVESLRGSITCAFKNSGQHRVSINRVSVEIYETGKEIPIEKGIIVNGSSRNTLPSGISGADTYQITLSEEVLKYKRHAIQLVFDATTDAIAVDRLLLNTKGYVDSTTVRKLAVQRYSFIIYVTGLR